MRTDDGQLHFIVSAATRERGGIWGGKAVAAIDDGPGFFSLSL